MKFTSCKLSRSQPEPHYYTAPECAEREVFKTLERLFSDMLLNSEWNCVVVAHNSHKRSSIERYFVSIGTQVRLLNRQEGVAKPIKFQSEC